MTVIVVCKDDDGNRPYRHVGVIAILTTNYHIKLIKERNRITSLDKELVENMMIEDCGTGRKRHADHKQGRVDR